MDVKKLLGKRIKEVRRQRNLTQEQLSEMINIETTTLSGIESGRHYPSLPTLEKISKTLNVEISSLFKFQHLQSIDILKAEIINRIETLDEQKTIFLYEFITKFTN